MRRIALFISGIAVFASCQKPLPDIKEDIASFTISYTLDKPSGSEMTKSSDAELWGKFYEKIKSGEFVAPSYSLIFTEKETGAKYEFKGNWADRDVVTLKTGEYNVTGKSNAEGRFIQERASISFDTDISISSTQGNIVLPASYNCFLLAFPKSDIKDLKNFVSFESNLGGKTSEAVDFYEFSDNYYAFSRKIYDSTYPAESYIKGVREDDTTFTIYTADIAFEKGKYYFYSGSSLLFSLPEMTPGE